MELILNLQKTNLDTLTSNNEQESQERRDDNCKGKTIKGMFTTEEQAISVMSEKTHIKILHCGMSDQQQCINLH